MVSVDLDDLLKAATFVGIVISSVYYAKELVKKKKPKHRKGKHKKHKR